LIFEKERGDVKELYDHVMKILNMICEEDLVEIKEDTKN
jgi:hypothetical protein